jgi:hypothetical protein
MLTLLSVTLFMTAAITASPLTAERAAKLVPTVVITPTACDYVCFTCPDPDEHIANWVGEPFGTMDGTEFEPCAPDGDCESHGCASANDAPAAVASVLREPVFWQALASAPAEDIRAFLRNNPVSAEFNRLRRSLQVRGCNGDLVVNLQLSVEQSVGLDK